MDKYCLRDHWSIHFEFAWYDLWVGMYINRAFHIVYICPLPCCLVSIWLPIWVKKEKLDAYSDGRV